MGCTPSNPKKSFEDTNANTQSPDEAEAAAPKPTDAPMPTSTLSQGGRSSSADYSAGSGHGTTINKDFVKTHFGTDFLISSWLFVVSTVLYVSVLAFEFGMGMYDGSAADVTWSYFALLIAGIFYLIGSIIFLIVSYPETFQQLMVDAQTVDIKKLSCTEKYFTGNILLTATWLFFIPTFVYIVYPVWSYVDGTISAGLLALYLIAIFFLLCLTFVWVLACFPENMQSNDGQGSSVFFDALCCIDCCCDDKQFLKRHFGSDFLAGAWIFAVVATFSVIACIYTICLSPTSALYWTFFTSALLFALGFYLLVYASYPENMGSTLVYDKLCCKSGGNSTNADEETPLLKGE